jgi:hypothetical protein
MIEHPAQAVVARACCGTVKRIMKNKHTHHISQPPLFADSYGDRGDQIETGENR